MSWSPFGKGLPGAGKLKMPSMEELRSSVESGARAMSSSVQAVGSSVKEAVGDVGLANAGAGADGARFVQRVRGVFDLDALKGQQSATPPPDSAAPAGHFPALDLTYITERIVVMGFPVKRGEGASPRAVAEFLNARHGSDYMVWNLSEKAYDYSPYRGQAMDFKFPGYPAPPIGTLFELCMSLESWLQASPANVAVIHCLTGRGRSAAVAACLLEWVGRAGRAEDALQFVCERRGARVQDAVVPTQLRYVRMFHDIMDGIRPRYEPLTLKRVTVHGVPNLFSKEDMQNPQLPPGGGCRPYLQVFKNGRLLFTTAWADEQSEHGTPVFACGESADGEAASFSLDVDCFIDGDILLRARHVDTASGKGSSMFRFGFHTGYAPVGTLRLARADLDGASADPRFPEGFCVEMEFAAAQPRASASGGDHSAPQPDPMFDAALSSKAAFWDEISRKKARARDRSASERARLVDAPAQTPAALEAAGATIAAAGDAARSPRGEPGAFNILDDDDDDKDRDDDRDPVGAGAGAGAAQDDLRSQLQSLLVMPQAPAAEGGESTGGEAAEVKEGATEGVPAAAEAAEVKEGATELRRSDVAPADMQSGAEDDDLAELEAALGAEVGEEALGTAPQPPRRAGASGAEQEVDEDPDLAELEEYLSEL